MQQQGVRYTRSKNSRQLVGASHLMPSGKWAARPSIVEDNGAGMKTLELPIPMPADAPLFETDHEAADYAIKVAVKYSADHPDPLG